MIKNITNEVENSWTVGLDISNPTPMNISVSSGSLNIERLDGELKTLSYPQFSFEVESDNDLDVVYDIYLLDQPSNSGNLIHIDRTEMGIDAIPTYEGEDTLAFTLATFLVPKGTVDLLNIEILSYKLVKKVD
jgi:hypothetical protein